MSINQRSYHILKRSKSDNDLHRRSTEDEWATFITECNYQNDRRAKALLVEEWVVSERQDEDSSHFSYYSDEPPPLPPRPVEQCAESEPDLLMPCAATVQSRGCSRIGRSLTTSNKQPSLDQIPPKGKAPRRTFTLKDTQELVRDKLIKRLFGTGRAEDDSRYMMSGALLDGSPGPEMRPPPKQSSHGRIAEFDDLTSSTSGAHSNSSSDMGASSDIFSRKAIHVLSRRSSPVLDPLQSPLISFTCARSATVSELDLRRNGLDAILASNSHQFESKQRQGIAASLPTELLQSIFRMLGPTDFNAARHTCRIWMAASLQLRLLAEQLKRGGWWTKAASSSVLFQEWRQAWPMSCYLSRECALAGDWKGNGLQAHAASEPVNPMQ